MADNLSTPPSHSTLCGLYTVVEVRVSVDASGSVVRAEAMPKAGVQPLLHDAAVQPQPARA